MSYSSKSRETYTFYINCCLQARQLIAVIGELNLPLLKNNLHIYYFTYNIITIPVNHFVNLHQNKFT
jgi:hypothetical protein